MSRWTALHLHRWHHSGCLSNVAWPFQTISTSRTLRVKAYLEVAEKFDFDGVMPAGDFNEQFTDFGQKITWTDSGPRSEPLIECLDELDKLRLPDAKPGTREGDVVEIIRQLATVLKGKRFLFGFCGGPFTGFCNLRGLKTSMHDMKKDRERMLQGIEIVFRDCMNYAAAQLDAGADGIAIFEPSCSLINPVFIKNILCRCISSW